MSSLSVGFLRGYARRCNARCWPKARSRCNEARYIRPQLSPAPSSFCRRCFSLSLSFPAAFLFLHLPWGGIVSAEDGWRRSSARNAKGGSREDARERERVELEARSVIRQVGIHIYRVVKSIGVSVSRVSCKEGLVGMRCELIERERRGGEDEERTNDRASYLDVGLTETENGKPPFLSIHASPSTPFVASPPSCSP